MKFLGRPTSIPVGTSGRGVRTTRPRPRPGIAFEHLEPRLLLSLNADGQAIPRVAPAVPPLQIVDVSPVNLNSTSDTFTGAGGSSVSTPQAGEITPLVINEGQLASPDGSATVQIPGGTTPFLVTLVLVSPQTQTTWSLLVRDRDNHEIGSVTVPRGNGGVTFEIMSPTSEETGPITVTVTAETERPGQTAGAFVLEVAPSVPVDANPNPPAVAADFTDYLFMSMTAGGNEFLGEESPSHSHTPPVPAASAAAAYSVAPPSGSSEPNYPKPTSGGVVRKELTGEPTAEELAEAEAAESDGERTGQDEVVVVGDLPGLLDPVASARQQVDAPGGLPGTDEAVVPRRVLARRVAEEGRLSHPGTTSGRVVISALLAAGLIVPNVLILGAPRFRPSRFRWRWPGQRRTSA